MKQMIKNTAQCALALALAALCGTNAWAGSNGATSAGDTTGSFSENNHTYTVTSTKYINPSGNDSANRNERGWYAGIKITWNSKTQKASSTTAKVTDSINAHNYPEFTIYEYSWGEHWFEDRDGSGLSGSGSSYWGTMYVTTVYWWAHITPEDAYNLNGADYTATLTIAGETFKIVIPATTYNAGLVDDAGVKWCPPVALIGSKVYGDLNVAIKTWGTVNCVADGAITEAITVETDSTLVLNKGDYAITGLENLSIKGGTYDFDPSAYVATGYKAYQEGDVWKIKVDHKHSWTYAVSTDGNVVTLTATCVNPECTLPAPYQTSATLTLSSGDKAYDGAAITAELAKGNFETLTGITLGDVQCPGNATDVGTYKFSVSAEGTGCDFGKSVTISQRDISGAVMTLSATSLPYSGADQTVTITSVKVGGLDVTYTEDTDSVRTAKAIGTYTVKITANGNFTGAASANWTITNYSGSLKSVAAAQSGVGTIEGNTLTVTDSSKLGYDSANQIWYAGLTLTWDWKKGDSYTTVDPDRGYAIFTKPDLAQMTIGDTTYTGYQSATFEGGKIDNATAELSYSKNLGNTKTCTYLNTTTFSVAITPAIIAAAKETGSITGTMYAGAFSFSESDDTQRSSGIAFQNYTINIPIDENLKLYDQYGNQVYPDANYVAQVGNYKYKTLAEAMTHATAELPVTLIGNAEAGTFEIGQNVTVNLGGFGNAEASYKFVNVTDEAMAAKVVSTKAENVTTEVTGFAVNNDNYTYTLYRAHKHLWEATTSGATLTASCTNMLTDCDIDGRQTAITLTVTGGSDGVAPAFAINNKDDFLSKVNKFSEVAAIGEITVVRTTDDGAETTKWYVGNYTASCIVTVNGEEKTITQDFSIAKSGEYTTGYAVASRDIRYDSLSEAVAAAKVGDTVYYRNGNLDQQNIYFNVDKDVILDCREATFTYTGTGGDMAICNNGAGTLTLQNVTIVEPVYEDFWGTDQYHNISLSGGNFVLGANVYVVKGSDEFQINAMANVGVSVTNGIYQCKFEEHETGASVEISGGVFWPYNDHCKPQASMIKDGYVVVTKSNETVGNYYEVVPHSHDLYYETNGNVITIRCEGAGYEGCDKTLNTYKLTLTAADAFEGSTYAGAAYTYDAGFEFDGADPEIEYYKDDAKVGTPSEYGSYEARVTVTINGHTATAVKAFNIVHVHQFKYDIAPSATLTATCTNLVSDCDIPDHTTAITLTVTDNGDGNQPTFAIANKDAFLAFVNRDATVATIGDITTVRTTDDGAETTKWYVGSYTSTCIVTISGVQYTLTTDFSIAKTTEYTSGWTVGSRDIRYSSWAEARTAAADGDTIHYRDGDRDNTEHDYSIDKNLTIDFGGYALKQTEDGILTADDMVIKNTGSGVLTIQNVVIRQPRKTYSGHIETEGNIVFGDGVKVVNTADDSANYCTITVNSGTLIVSNGLYQCGFATDGGTVNLRAGKYWENDKPALGQYNLADRACIEIEGDYKYEIVPHVHSFAYTAEGNVITSVCNGKYKEGCYWYQNPQTATLTASDAAESSEPYAGASVAYSEFWAGSKELTITYWQGETQLGGAPTRFGTYTAKIAIGDAVAAKDFTVTPMAVTVTVPNVANATVVVKEGETVVVSQTEEYSVTHGATVTATYTPAEGYVPTNAVVKTIACAEPGSAIDASEIVFTRAAAKIVTDAGATTNYYATLKAAVAAVPYEGLVTLCRDASGDGIVIAADKSFALDLGGYTYTVVTNPVGSAGTETLGFQILAGAEVDVKNGTVTSAKGSGVKMLVQNYATLLVNGATLDGRNLDGEGKVYTLSNNNGFTQVINFGEVIARGDGDIAMDACTFGSYDGTEVLLDGGRVAGDIEVSWYAGTKPSHAVRLNLQTGTVTGRIVLDPTADTANVRVWNSGAVDVGIPEGWLWNGDGVLTKCAAKIGAQYYLTLVEAVTNAVADDAIKLLANVTNGAGIFVEKSQDNLTFDFGGFTYAVAGPAVGSAGTKTQAFHIEAANCTLANGTLACVDENRDRTWEASAADKGVAMLVQNYSNLTIADMTLDGRNVAKARYSSGFGPTYTLSNGGTASSVTIRGASALYQRADETAITNYAIDVSANVTVDGAAIYGNVELDGGNLTLESGSISGILGFYWSTEPGGEVQKRTGFAVAAPAGYVWKQIGTTNYERLQTNEPTVPAGQGTITPDPEEENTYVVEPAEGTNRVDISNLPDDSTVKIPPTVETVTGVSDTDQLKIVADATNSTGTVEVDITDAFTVSRLVGNDTVVVELNSNAVVTVEIAGRDPEDIAVIPELGTATGTTVEETPFVVTGDAVATGVKTIPGLKYSLLSGDAPNAIDTVVKTIVAEDTRVVLEAAKGEDATKFYKIQVEK